MQSKEYYPRASKVDEMCSPSHLKSIDIEPERNTIKFLAVNNLLYDELSMLFIKGLLELYVTRYIREKNQMNMSYLISWLQMKV